MQVLSTRNRNAVGHTVRTAHSDTESLVGKVFDRFLWCVSKKPIFYQNTNV